MRRFHWVFRYLVLGLALGSAGAASAQTVSATTGAINGKVTDTTGAILPGVTISISSPSMQGTRTDITREDGAYRFSAIPPGDYTITYELSGFEKVTRQGLRVGLGFTATVNIELRVASLAESVTVSGQSPVVDVATTKTSTNFDSQQLASLPNARDFWSILAAAPAIQMQRIDVGGSAAGTQTGYSTYDTKSDQHRPMVEGIVNTEGTNAAGFYYDYGSVEEVSLTTGANTADMPWAGVMSQFIAKSGGNTYHGRIYADYENENIQSRNIDAAQIALGVKGAGNLGPTDLNRLHSYHDVNGDIGGYVKRDKLWWYSSLRDQDAQSLLPNFPVKPFETHLQNITGKGTYALNPNNKLVAFGQWGLKQQPNRLDTFLIPATIAIHNSPDSTWNQSYWAHTYKVGWDDVVNDKMFFEVHGGQFHYLWPNTRYTQAPAYEDLSTNIVSGGNQDGWFRDITRNQILGSLSYFKDGWAGSHNLKVGGEFFNERYDDLRGQNGLGQVPGDVLMVLSRGKPSEVVLFQSPTASLNGLWTTGLYASDLWRLNSRLTVTLGVVFDRYRSYLPAQTGPPVGPFNPTQTNFAAVDNLITWNLTAPRVGLTYDLGGNGKTVLKANYASYWWNPGTTAIDSLVNPNSPDWYRRYVWNDTNGDGVWQPGEQGQLNTSRGGVGSTQLDPNLQDQRTREVATWFEHELFPNVGVHAGFVWRRIDQLYQSDNLNRPVSAFNVPVTIHDPGPDGTAGAAGTAIQAWNLNPANLALPVVNFLHNTPGKDDFYNIEFSANRRLNHGWSLNASYAYRWNRDNSTGYFGNTLRAAQDISNPNDMINTDNGRYDFGLWAAKINGSYEAPWGLRITPAVRMQSGQPYARTFLASLNYSSTQRILAEPFGSRQQDNIILVDARVEKSFKILTGHTVSGFIDGYNLTNANPAQNINWSSGGTFMQPTTIVPPRLFRFGVKFDW
ncbi:MAG TPA: carboxypeptidase regulatory-like domain-containing protein [Vicinamibacterales bacterium]|nr:carboxypeptidase regulatory-like domain-containing protein [Vicinamibacterales bacterium]